jgi:hypothetical protein
MIQKLTPAILQETAAIRGVLLAEAPQRAIPRQPVTKIT